MIISVIQNKGAYILYIVLKLVAAQNTNHAKIYQSYWHLEMS